MILVILSQDLYLAPKIVVGTLDELELTDLPMPLQILSLDLAPAFVVALNNFAETAVVMGL